MSTQNQPLIQIRIIFCSYSKVMGLVMRIHALQSSIKDLGYEIITAAQSCSNTDILQTVRKHMLSAISVIKCANEDNNHTNETDEHSSTVDFEKTMAVAPNANFVPQLRFRSTKNKKASKKRWAKPTKIEEEETKSKMKKTIASVCGICWKEEDSALDTTGDILWLECEICGLWEQ